MADMKVNTSDDGFKKPRSAAQLANDQRLKDKAAEKRAAKDAATAAPPVIEDVIEVPAEVDKAEVEARVNAMPITPIDNIAEDLLAKEKELERDITKKVAPAKPKVKSITDKPVDEMNDEELLKAAAITEARETLRKQRAAQTAREIELKLMAGEKNMELVIAQEPLVEVYIPWYEGCIETQNVVINGVKKVVPLGEHVLLPKPHAEVLFEMLNERRKNFKRFKTAQKRFETFQNVIRV
jgi:hypothetical protein